MKEVEHLRKSQFVLTYGPGAIIESRNGPRIIPSINNGLGEFFSTENLKNFEITDQRLRIAIKNIKNEDARIFSIPSNALLGKSESEAIYHTYIFPIWKICYGRKGNHKHKPILYKGKKENKCPICNTDYDSSAVRFVRACVNGHLDEVDWRFAVHHNSKCNSDCNPEYYLWKASGSALSDITVECPKCGCSTTLKEIYRTNSKCTGRFPEREDPESPLGGAYFPREDRPYDCDKEMRVIQLQSSSLHIPETITLLTIPEYDSNLYNIMQQSGVLAIIKGVIENKQKPCEEVIDKEDTKKLIETILKHLIPDESFQIIKNGIENDVKTFCNIFKRILDEEKKTFLNFIYEEFESLKAGPRTTDNFKILPGQSLPFHDENGDILPKLTVFPVEKLKTITAQTGYYRMPVRDNTYTVVSVGKKLRKDPAMWYPGYESIGEGIFLTFSDGHFSKFSESKAYKEWKNGNISNLTDNFSGKIWENIQQEPMFVWWHTLSHALIRAISLYSGYSSASLRERVYINSKFDDGGILIYTSSPGEDGSMGGLVGTVDAFDEILKKAIDGIKFCSNDPLCYEVRKTSGIINGAACYSCLLIPETSCEHKNMWLDRHILLGD